MKKYENFINEYLGQKKQEQVEMLISYLEKNTNYTFAKYGENFKVEKFKYKSKFNSILYLMIDDDIEKNERKAIRFNYTNFNVFSVDMWEDFVFNLEEGQQIYNKPSYEMKIPSNISNIAEDLVAFVEGEFLDELKEAKTSVKESPEESVESTINDLDGYDLDPFEAIKYNVLQVAFNKKTTSFILSGLSGMGKCLAKGTKVIMSNGKLKNVEDIQNGEYVMGPDSKKKLVSGVTSGKSEMYEIQQNKGMNYTVNKDHILTLKKSDFAIKKGYFKDYDNIVNITIEDYLQKNKHWKDNFYGYKVNINFPKKELKIDPYYMGLWLGDGSKHETTIANIDEEIIDYIHEYADSIDQVVSIRKAKDRIATYHIIGKDFETTKNRTYTNQLFENMKDLNIINNKNIHDDYLYNDEENRLKLLAGLIDSDGSVCSNGYEITQKRKDLTYQIKFLADSLGFKTSIREIEKNIKAINFTGTYYRVRIYGDLEKVPVLLERKKIFPNRKVDHKITGFKIIEKPIDEYFGFTVKDSLFLLEDTTVVHNTFDVKKTLKDVHKPFRYFKGNSSAAGLYELLFLYRHELIVLDDMDDVLISKDTKDILKAVLDTGETRELDRRLKGYFNAVGWDDEEIQEEYEKTGNLPNKFEFTGSIIFITNLKEEKIDPVIFTRTLHVDISLEFEEIMARIKTILPKMHPGVSLEDKEETLDVMVELLDTYVEKAPLNLRTLYHCINFKVSNDNLTKKVGGKDIPLWILLVKKFLVRNTKLKDIK